MVTNHSSSTISYRKLTAQYPRHIYKFPSMDKVFIFIIRQRLSTYSSGNLAALESSLREVSEAQIGWIQRARSSAKNDQLRFALGVPLFLIKAHHLGKQIFNHTHQ